MRDIGSRFEISRRFGELWNIWGLRGWLYVVDVGFGMYIGRLGRCWRVDL